MGKKKISKRSQASISARTITESGWKTHNRHNLLLGRKLPPHQRKVTELDLRSGHKITARGVKREGI